MGEVGTSIWQQLGAIYGVGSFVQIVLGGALAIFKPWTPTEDDVVSESILESKSCKKP